MLCMGPHRGLGDEQLLCGEARRAPREQIGRHLGFAPGKPLLLGEGGEGLLAGGTLQSTLG